MHPLFITLPELADDLCQFEQKLSSFAQQLGLRLSELTIDHISLRCHQERTAERWAQGLSQQAHCFSEAIIGGRPIHLYRLEQPLIVLNHPITIIELPWPGEKRYRHQGWEHIEVVLPGAPEQIGQRAMALIDDRGLMMPDIKIKTRRPEAKAGALDNTTLAITQGDITVKFHTYAIDDVVASEQ